MSCKDIIVFLYLVLILPAHVNLSKLRVTQEDKLATKNSDEIFRRVERDIQVPGLSNECYIKHGDVMFGLLTSIRGPGSQGQLCSSHLFWDAAVQETEAFVYALNTVSARRNILHNLSLGFVILDDCNTDLAALSRSLFFLPDSNLSDGRIRNSSSLVNDSSKKSKLSGPYSCQMRLGEYRVAGVVGPYGSRRAALAASLLGVFHIPMISTYATSDELSDQRRYQYFLRLVAPDRTQAQAMVEFMVTMNWTYGGLLYSEGEYGADGAKSIERFSKLSAICLGLIRELPSQATRNDIVALINNLLTNTTIKVVMLFLEDYHLYSMFGIIEELNLQGKLIWLASDAMAYDTFGIGANGAFVMHHIDGYYPTFDDYYKSLTPANSSNPWLWDLWQSLYNCEWSQMRENYSCYTYDSKPYLNHVIESYVYKTIDAVDMFAIGMNTFVNKICPEAYINKNVLQSCINGEDYLETLKASNFTGISGVIDFQNTGYIRGRFAVKQYLAGVQSRGETVAIWEEGTSINVLYADIVTDVYHMPMTEHGYPESVCSKPCKGRQYTVQLELPCCWECRHCRPNECLHINGTSCVPCPPNTWPHQTDAFACVPIEADYLKWNDGLAIGLQVLSLCGFFFSTVVAILMIRWRGEKLIKASSRSLSTIILAGIGLAFASVLLFIATPTQIVCDLRSVCFHIAATVIYAPLFLKTNRVYRIFMAGKRGVQKPKFINATSQLIGITFIVWIQVALIVISFKLWPTKPDIRMPMADIPYVERFCKLSPEGLLLPLSFNLLLILTCACFGFLTRKLPENFNESWYIFVSVTTTLFLWVVFLPTYFSVFYYSHQAALLGFCLILNATITLLCLFATRLYGVIYVAENMMNIVITTNTIAVAPVEVG